MAPHWYSQEAQDNTKYDIRRGVNIEEVALIVSLVFYDLWQYYMDKGLLLPSFNIFILAILRDEGSSTLLSIQYDHEV